MLHQSALRQHGCGTARQGGMSWRPAPTRVPHAWRAERDEDDDFRHDL